MRRELRSAFLVMEQTPHAWSLFADRDGTQPFIFTNDYATRRIMNDIYQRHLNHSATSLALVCRHMECVAKNGWSFYKYYIAGRATPKDEQS
jgi:hypothetical protein